MEDDDRFKHIATDPKFRRIPKAERKVKVDKRFKSMFKSKQFKVKYTIDKRGRPVNHTSSEDLKRYYELSSGAEDSEDEHAGGTFVRAPKSDNEDEFKPEEFVEDKLRIRNYVQAPILDKSKAKEGKIAGIEEDSTLLLTENIKNNDFPSNSANIIPDKIKHKLRNLVVDYARGESNLLSESSSDDESSTSETEEADTVEHAWGELDHDAERTEEITTRLAVCNMDWDRIKALDLMVLLSSFLPPGGLIHSVKIYPSEFGLQRMREEEVKGPTELTQKHEDGENDGEEGSKYHMEKLRQYQLNRLKYYYAVVTFDSKNSANKIYTECDGLEYESSATKIDLRFIPEDMDFDQEPKEACEKLPEQGKYQPRFFTTTALQQAKVNLTWDETNPDRIEITQKLATGKIDDVSDGDLQAYLASSSEEENNEEITQDIVGGVSDTDDKKSSLEKYKLLLEDINIHENARKNKDVEMEITWGIDLKDKTDKMIKKKLQDKEDKTPFQKYLEKRKEKRKMKKEQKQRKSESEDSSIPSDIDMNDPYFAEEFNNVKSKKNIKKPLESEDDPNKNAELELLLSNNQASNKHFSLQKIQERENIKTKKQKNANDNNKNQEEDDFQINVADPRFSALYSSHHYNVDPTDPHFKETKGMQAIKSEKLKRRNFLETNITTDSDIKQTGKKDAELSVLVKSIKRKTKAISSSKPKKRF